MTDALYLSYIVYMSNDTPQETWLKTSEVIERLGVPKTTLIDWIRDEKRRYFPTARKRNPFAINSTWLIAESEVEAVEAILRGESVAEPAEASAEG